jgi:hypothetical protein
LQTITGKIVGLKINVSLTWWLRGRFLEAPQEEMRMVICSLFLWPISGRKIPNFTSPDCKNQFLLPIFKPVN